MKKLGLLLCLMVLATGVFAMDIAVGGGILYNNTTTVGQVNFDFGFGDEMKLDWELNRNGFGAFAFVGLSQFLELNLGFLYKDPSKVTLTVDGKSESSSDFDMESVPALQIGIYGKYPFVINETMVVFPTVGIDYELTLADEKEGWWDDLWIRAGVGLDYFFSETIFLRGHLIYGVALPMGSNEYIDFMNPEVGHGLLVKVGVGFMM